MKALMFIAIAYAVAAILTLIIAVYELSHNSGNSNLYFVFIGLEVALLCAYFIARKFAMLMSYE
jgi:hypothetical protein